MAGELTAAQFEDELIRLLSDARAYFFVLYTEDTQERLVSSGMDQREARSSSAAVFGRAHYCFAEDIMVGIGPIRETRAVSAYFAERRSRISSLDTIYGRCIEGAMEHESERRSIDYAPEIRPAICGRLSTLAADIAAQLEAEIPAWRIRASSLVRSREISERYGVAQTNADKQLIDEVIKYSPVQLEHSRKLGQEDGVEKTRDFFFDRCMEVPFRALVAELGVTAGE